MLNPSLRGAELMGEFVNGWRRKIGSLTLLIALAFTGLWVRSFSTTDDHVTVWRNHSLYSHNGAISWNISSHDEMKPAEDVQPPTIVHKWRWEWGGFVASDISFYGQSTVQYWVPYWYFILPLTLISAYLFLRPSQQEPITTKFSHG